MSPITTTADLATFCDRIADASFIAVDTEFMRETTYWPKLCLVQVAAPNIAANIDPLAEGLDLAPLLKVLADPRVIKVFHAARQDVEIFNNLGVIPKPLFDTQIAAMAAGFGEQIAYDALVRQMLKIDLDKSSRFTDWARRPLSEAQLSYALADVTHLAALYPQLRDRLAQAGRLDWVTEEMAQITDPALYDLDPENAWKRLKPRKVAPKYLAVLRGVAAWRERTAQTRDQPRGRILKDDAIDEIANQAPLTADDLNRLRAVPKGVEKKTGLPKTMWDIEGPSVIGSGNLFYAYASIGQQTQDLKYRGEPTHLRIGDENTFREFTTVHRGTAPDSWTRIGSRGNFLAYSHVAHDCVIGDGVIFSNNGTVAGHVEVHDCAVIGGLTAIHQYCRIGRHAITGGCSKIVQDVPPFMIADGNPAETRTINKVGMERQGISDESQNALKQAYKILFREGLSIPNALAKIEKELPSLPEVQYLVQFVRASERGISK